MDVVVRTSSLPTIAEGIADKPYMSRYGAQYMQDWKNALVAAGKVFYAKVGDFSTPVVGGGAGTIIDLDQPEFAIAIPSGKTLIPISFRAQALLPLLAADADETEILISADLDAKWALDGTWANTITPRNLKNKSGNTSALTVKSVCSVDTTESTSTLIELARAILNGDVQGTAANAMWNKNTLIYEPEPAPLISGPATILVHWGGTVATYAFLQAIWAEINTEDL
jgi:hypothetical protein